MVLEKPPKIEVFTNCLITHASHIFAHCTARKKIEVGFGAANLYSEIRDLWYNKSGGGVMVSVNGYFDGTACVAVDTSQFHPNQRLVITALDEDFTDGKLIEKNVKKN